MTVNEMTLRAYVDGELDRAEAEQVKHALAFSADVQWRVRLLRASQLPYTTAFASQQLPEVPQRLRQHLQSWMALAEKSGPGLDAVPNRRRWLGIGAAVATSFATGLWVPVPLRLTPVVAQDPPWMQAIARYQALYVRETVDRTKEDPGRAQMILASFVADSGRHVSIPDLRPMGWTLGRVQRLAVDDLPLIHMEYLPTIGKPMSLCILAAHRVDSGIVTRRVAGLGVSAWHRGGLEFVMVADKPVTEVAGLAERVAKEDIPTLYRS